jgi:hypothetical protein
MGFVKSTNGGASFSPFDGNSVFTYSGIKINNQADVNFGGISVNDFPFIACDRSSGPFRGYIYAVMAENVGSQVVDSDIKFARSTDDGLTWQTGFANSTGYVNKVRTGQQIFPTISVDDITGRIDVVYYSRDIPGNTSYCVYLATSIDGARHLRSL